MFQPAYYQGRLYGVMHCTSHPCTYVYVFTRRPSLTRAGTILSLVHTDAYWRDNARYGGTFRA